MMGFVSISHLLPFNFDKTFFSLVLLCLCLILNKITRCKSKCFAIGRTLTNQNILTW